MPNKKRIVIFASGNGSNAQNIIRYFSDSPLVQVSLVLSNKETAQVLKRAQKENIPASHFTKAELLDYKKGVLKMLKKINPDLIVLSGFLLKFPEYILKEFPNKVINIHPALLPKYGGKGMYGKFVHQAVLQNKEAETGITIHYVNENYDEGAVIFQESISLSKDETPESIAEKVHSLEHEHFPKVIEKLLTEVDG